MPALVGVIEDEEGHRIEVEELLELAHRRIEDLVQVEGGGQGLGDLVQLVQEGVGIREPAQAVHGEDLSTVRLAGDVAGIPSHDATSSTSTDHCRDVRASSSTKVGSRNQGRVTATIATVAIRSPNPNPRANPATATAVRMEKARGEAQ